MLNVVIEPKYSLLKHSSKVLPLDYNYLINLVSSYFAESDYSVLMDFYCDVLPIGYCCGRDVWEDAASEPK